MKVAQSKQPTLTIRRSTLKFTEVASLGTWALPVERSAFASRLSDFQFSPL